MPVGHNWQKCKLKFNKCPCCDKPDKIFNHLLGCKNKKMTQARERCIYSCSMNALNSNSHFTSRPPS